jgi:hypothetical protein
MPIGLLNNFNENAALLGQANAFGSEFIQERAALIGTVLYSSFSCDIVAITAAEGCWGAALSCDTVASTNFN